MCCCISNLTADCTWCMMHSSHFAGFFALRHMGTTTLTEQELFADQVSPPKLWLCSRFHRPGGDAQEVKGERKGRRYSRKQTLFSFWGSGIRMTPRTIDTCSGLTVRRRNGNWMFVRRKSRNGWPSTHIMLDDLTRFPLRCCDRPSLWSDGSFPVTCRRIGSGIVAPQEWLARRSEAIVLGSLTAFIVEPMTFGIVRCGGQCADSPATSCTHRDLGLSPAVLHYPDAFPL
jgi:hypothetical protein